MSGMLVMVGMMDKKEGGRKKIFNGIGFKISLDRFKKRCFHIVPLYEGNHFLTVEWFSTILQEFSVSCKLKTCGRPNDRWGSQFDFRVWRF